MVNGVQLMARPSRRGGRLDVPLRVREHRVGEAVVVTHLVYIRRLTSVVVRGKHREPGAEL